MLNAVSWIRRHRWLSVLVVAAAGLAVWHWRGPIISSLSDVSNLLLLAFGLYLAMRPGRAAQIEGSRNLRRFLGGVLIVVGTVGLVSGYYDKKKTRDVLNQLVAASATQATKEDVQSLKNEVGLLRGDTKAGFANVVDAINRLGDRLVGKSFAPTPKPEIKEPQPSFIPPIIEHIRFTQKRVPVPSGGPQFGTQVIVQTDVASQPTTIRLEANGNIEKANFFIVGQPVMMNVRTVIDHNVFTLSFGYPAFTPESPVVITLLSNSDITITKVERMPL
jgi:hypothetical protein